MRDIQMVDLRGQYEKIKTEVNSEILNVLDSGAYINGPLVKSLANDLGEYIGSSHCIPCGNGTDALQIALMALGLEPGDEVITVPFTFIATAEVISLLNLKTVFVDVEPGTYNMKMDAVEAAITEKTKCIIPVHLFGQAVNMESLMKLADAHGIPVLEDNAQSLGAEYLFTDGTRTKVGNVGKISTTSFYPSKSLGCYGDGGAIFTSDDELAANIRMIVNHGSKEKYYHEVVGVNSRLDSIQASILGIKLKKLDEYIVERQKAAAFYDNGLAGIAGLQTPTKSSYSTHIYHQYTLTVDDKRDELHEALSAKGIPTMVYYPVPLHLQKAYPNEGGAGSFPVSESLASKVLSLPMHTELQEDQLEFIVESIVNFFK